MVELLSIEPEELRTTANTQRLIQIFAKQYESNPKVVLRELIQNAADAITASKKLFLDTPSQIEVEILSEEDRRCFDVDLAVRDFAGGMDQNGFKNYLACLGQGTKENDLDTIGEWGIGFYSIVVIANSAIIVTKTKGASAIVYRYIAPPEDRYIPISDKRTVDWLLNREYCNGSQSGTSIYLKIDFARWPQLRDWLVPQRLLPELRTYCLFVPYPIKICGPDKAERYTANITNYPWDCHDANRSQALTDLWKAILPHTPQESYPRLTFCFAQAPDSKCHLSGVIYFIHGYAGGVNVYFKSIYVECALDMLPTWAKPLTVHLNVKSTPESPLHLDVPPSRTNIVRTDGFFKLLPLLEERIIEFITDEMDRYKAHLDRAINSADSEKRSNKIEQVNDEEEVFRLMSAIGEHKLNMCLDLSAVMAEALSGSFCEKTFRQSAMKLFDGLIPQLSEDNIVQGLRNFSELTKKAGLEERERQKTTMKSPSWYPDSSKNFVSAHGESLLVCIVMKEFPSGNQPTFTRALVPLFALSMLDPTLVQENGKIRVPILNRGEADDYLYGSDSDRFVVVVKEQDLAFLVCTAQLTGRYQLDLVGAKNTQFRDAAHPEDWTDLVDGFRRLIEDKAKRHSHGTHYDFLYTVDVAAFDPKDIPVVFRDVEGRPHLTINAWNRGIIDLNQTLKKVLQSGDRDAAKSLYALIHEMYHSSVYNEDVSLSEPLIHVLAVKEQVLSEICDLVRQRLDIRASHS